MHVIRHAESLQITLYIIMIGIKCFLKFLQDLKFKLIHVHKTNISCFLQNSNFMSQQPPILCPDPNNSQQKKSKKQLHYVHKTVISCLQN